MGLSAGHPRGKLVALMALAALALSGCGLGADAGEEAPSTSGATATQVRQALALFAADGSLAVSRADACREKVEAGEYSDYDACWIAEIRQPAIDAEAQAKAMLAETGEASPECRKAIERAIDDVWLKDDPLGPSGTQRPSESSLVRVCQPAE